MQISSTTRRQFLKTTAAGGVLSIVPRHVLGGLGYAPPNEKMNIAGVGVGGKGYSDLANSSSENIVALCDVDLGGRAARTVKAYPKAKLYKDYRIMLEKQKDIDGVIIATPDHTHAVIAAAAMKAGKHVYCQKPLTHDVYEARMLARIAKETGVTTQMGNQGNSNEGHRLICEWIWDGAIGEVKEVDAWCSLSYYNWGYPRFSPDWWRTPLKDKPALPEGLEWDLWLGPAQERSYHSAYHPGSWRCWWDFGSGMMGDRGAHTLACVHDAMKLGHVESVDAANLGANLDGTSGDVHPISALVTYRFPQRGDLPPLTVRWYEGMNPPWPPELEDGRKLPSQGGVIFRGTKGAIMAGWMGDSPRIIPEAVMKAYKRPEKTLPRVKGTHQQAWIRACKEGKQPSSHFGFSGPLTEFVQLGNVAKRFPNNRLLWDGEEMQVTNYTAANEWVKRPYREGWSL